MKSKFVKMYLLVLVSLVVVGWWLGAPAKVQAGELRIGDILLQGRLEANATAWPCTYPEDPAFSEQVVEIPATRASASASLACDSASANIRFAQNTPSQVTFTASADAAASYPGTSLSQGFLSGNPQGPTLTNEGTTPVLMTVHETGEVTISSPLGYGGCGLEGEVTITFMIWPGWTIGLGFGVGAQVGTSEEFPSTTVTATCSQTLTFAPQGPSDLLIKRASEPDSAYALDDVYQSAPSGEQIEAQTVEPGKTATYNVRVENDGDEERSFVLKATETGETGWTITYLLGGFDITSEITSAGGYTTSTMAPGGSEVISVEMTPDETALGTTQSVIIEAFLDDAEETVRDSVQADATAARLVVNSTGDLSDLNVSDGVCDTGALTAQGKPECTLRAAIQQANALPGQNTITFAMPGQTIRPTRELDEVTDPVIIDGTTQRGGRVILYGSQIAGAADGLKFTSGDNVVKGLVIRKFRGRGIVSQQLLRLQDVGVLENGGDGIVADQGVVIEGQFNEAYRNAGVGVFAASGDVDISNGRINVTRNYEEGILAPDGKVTINLREDGTSPYPTTQAQIVDNRGRGIVAKGGVEGAFLNVSFNQLAGTDVEVGGIDSQGPVMLISSRVYRNKGTGVSGSTIKIEGQLNEVSRNEGVGIIATSGDVDISNGRINVTRNYEEGILAPSGKVTINLREDGTSPFPTTPAQIVENRRTGIVAQGGVEGAFLNVSGNQAAAARTYEGVGGIDSQGPVRLISSQVNSNKGIGMSGSTIRIEGVLNEVNSNGDDGIVGQSLRATNLTVTKNKGDGIVADEIVIEGGTVCGNKGENLVGDPDPEITPGTVICKM